MKVLCLKEGNRCEYDGGAPAPQGPKIEVGSIYTVCRIMNFSDGDYYFLQGFPNDVCYWSLLFAILPDAEPETVTEEETEYATV
jgi:hypothetical protein